RLDDNPALLQHVQRPRLLVRHRQPTNRWTGRNRNATTAPASTAFSTTWSPPRTGGANRPPGDLLVEQMTNLVVMPLYWLPNPFFVTKGVLNAGNTSPSNLFAWDKA